MSGQGKYTKYAPDASGKNTLLDRLFKGNSAVSSPFAELTGKEEDARLQTLARAKELLSPADGIQQGDPGHFPAGVNMNYTGDPNGIESPDLDKVKWESAGDPANAYAPDISSPGPGLTDPSSKDVDPEVSVVDLKGPGYVPGAPGTGTKSPSKTAEAIKDNSELGTPGVLAYDVNGFG